jgi:hypothetical protein
MTRSAFVKDWSVLSATCLPCADVCVTYDKPFLTNSADELSSILIVGRKTLRIGHGFDAHKFVETEAHPGWRDHTLSLGLKGIQTWMSSSMR